MHKWEGHNCHLSATCIIAISSIPGQDSSCEDSIIAVAVSATVSFVIAFILGTTVGASVVVCARCKGQRSCSSSPEDTDVGHTYDTVFFSSQRGRQNIKLNSNLAYGHVKRS